MELTHFNEQGRARMVDVTEKEKTFRVARAAGEVRMNPETAQLVRDGRMKKGDVLAVAQVEGWRGELCHVAVTDAEGRFGVYKIYDPSWHNWSGLEMALRGEQISDFPLCNKSFNLSYCGHDL